MYYSTTYRSPIGALTLASDGACLIGLWIEGQKYYGSAFPKPLFQNDDAAPFPLIKQWLSDYFAGARIEPSDLPLRLIGGEFRQNVWNALRGIPYGETTTYGEIAKIIAANMGRESMSSQAIGGAVGHNPISIVIPCHRVIGANGSVTGYAGGIAVKTRLLALEGADMTSLFVPKKLRAATGKEPQ